MTDLCSPWVFFLFSIIFSSTILIMDKKCKLQTFFLLKSRMRAKKKKSRSKKKCWRATSNNMEIDSGKIGRGSKSGKHLNRVVTFRAEEIIQRNGKQGSGCHQSRGKPQTSLSLRPLMTLKGKSNITLF